MKWALHESLAIGFIMAFAASKRRNERGPMRKVQVLKLIVIKTINMTGASVMISACTVDSANTKGRTVHNEHAH